MHQDKFRSAPPNTKSYKNNHDAIFGPAQGAKTLTKAEQDQQELRNKQHHAKLAEDGKKPADWYLDNERRVPQDPERQEKRKPVTDAYMENHKRIFGDKETP